MHIHIHAYIFIQIFIHIDHDCLQPFRTCRPCPACLPIRALSACQHSCTCLLMWSCRQLEIASALHRSEFLYRERFNLAGAHRDLLVDAVPAASAAPAAPGGPFAVAWRNYVRTVFQKGFMYRLSCKPSVILYIAENKVLAGREDRTYEGEALGRKMAIVFFEDMGAGLVRRVNRETFGMHQVLLNIAEILQTLQAIDLPPDPERTAAQTELLIETRYEHLEILRLTCTLEPAAPEVHVYHLDGKCRDSLGPRALCRTPNQDGTSKGPGAPWGPQAR